MVTKAQLKAHAEEAERRSNIITMGGDPTTIMPATTLSVAPITGNDIFESRALKPTPTLPTNGGDTSGLDDFLCPPTPVTSLPHLVPPYSIEDDDFPPDPFEHPHDPPKVPEYPDYPSMGTLDSDMDQDEGGIEDQDAAEGLPNLEEFMDLEYLKQGTSPPSACVVSRHSRLMISYGRQQPLEI